MLYYDDLVNELISTAKNGDRIVFNEKTIWSGLGNRSGLHDYAQTVIHEKWEKSGKRFQNKIEKLAKTQNATFKIQMFKNIDRDRGRWVTTQTLILKSESEETETKRPKVERAKIKSMFKNDLKPTQERKEQLANQMIDLLENYLLEYLQEDKIKIAHASAIHLDLDKNKVGDALVNGWCNFSLESIRLMKELFNKDVSALNFLTIESQTISKMDEIIESTFEYEPEKIVEIVSKSVQRYGWDEDTAKSSLHEHLEISENTLKRYIKKYF